MLPPPSPTVDTIMATRRAASFTTRSIKRESKLAALRLAVSMVDLTTLEGADTPEKVRSLCHKAIRPWERDEQVLGERLPTVAAVCVYPSMVAAAAGELAGTGVRVASVATGFPSGQYPLPVRLDDVRRAVEAGADEIDMVINRGAMLAGDEAKVADEIAAVADTCGRAHLKVILETGELATLDTVRRASDVAIANIRDGDFIKTSTGKVSPAATMPVTLVMLEAIRDEWLRTTPLDAESEPIPMGEGSDLLVAPLSKRCSGEARPDITSTQPTRLCHQNPSLRSKTRSDPASVGLGKRIGMKPAGGIRTAKQAWHYLCMVNETLGAEWLTPELFRFGASSLLNDLLRQIEKLATGTYAAAYDFSEA